MTRYKLPFISLLVICLAFAYIELFVEDFKIIVPLKKSWEIAVPQQKLPTGLGSMRAQDCGICHVQHYEEWQKSTHAQAWKDLQFQAELKKESSPFMCINCHIPLQNQQRYIIQGLENGDIYAPIKVLNPDFDSLLQQEGITCVSCHLRNHTIIGPTGSSKGPHEVKKDKIHLSERLCIGCHNANAVVTPTLACSFETGDEWKAGPYFGKKNCIDCHMPKTQRSIVQGFAIRTSRFHNFPASGIPKLDTLCPDRLESLKFGLRGLKNTYKIGDDLKFNFEITNSAAGHRVPTGNPERFILVEMVLKDTCNYEIDKVVGRIGEHWEWYPEAKKINDNNLNPGELRVFNFDHTFKASGAYQLSISVSKHRLTPSSASFNKLGSNYPLFIEVYHKTSDIVVY